MKQAGFLLAGGQSSRMGQDKALLKWENRTVLEVLAKRVYEAAGSCTVIGPALRYGSLGWPMQADDLPGIGPAGGILSVLRHSRADYNLVLACDLPLAPAQLLSPLLQAAQESSAQCVLAAAGEDRPQPLCGIYHSACRAAFEDAAERGIRKMHDILAGLDVSVWRHAEPAWLTNVNTPADWAALQP